MAWKGGDEVNHPTHIVAVGGLVEREDGQILLVRSFYRGWEFPGGQVEVGESLPQALIREIYEESGITVEVVDLAGIYSNVKIKANGTPTIVNIDFRCRYVSGELRGSDETAEAAFFPPERARELVQYGPYPGRLAHLLDDRDSIACEAYEGVPPQYVERYQFARGSAPR